jgi:hypothetical protein
VLTQGQAPSKTVLKMFSPDICGIVVVVHIGESKLDDLVDA